MNWKHPSEKVVAESWVLLRLALWCAAKSEGESNFYCCWRQIHVVLYMATWICLQVGNGEMGGCLTCICSLVRNITSQWVGHRCGWAITAWVRISGLGAEYSPPVISVWPSGLCPNPSPSSSCTTNWSWSLLTCSSCGLYCFLLASSSVSPWSPVSGSGPRS